MTITAPQRVAIMTLWGRVCKNRGWKQSDRDLRLAKFGEIIGRPIASADEIERIDECTKLMKELGVLLGVSLQAAREADDLTINKARVLRNQILTELVPCLELYVADVRAYMTEIMADKNRWWKIDRPVRDITIMDLDAAPIRKWDVKQKRMRVWPSQLEQLQYTLAARLNDKRNENVLVPAYVHLQGVEPLTIHQMKLAACVPCACAICKADTAQKDRIPEPF
jgi:hypothetical protein